MTVPVFPMVYKQAGHVWVTFVFLIHNESYKEEDREARVKMKEKNNKIIQTGVEIFVVTVVWQFGQRTTVLLLTEYRRILLLC